MARYSTGNTPPLGHWNNLPIYLTTIVTAGLVVGLIVSALLMSARSPLLVLLDFQMPLVPAWSLWRLFTYVFISKVDFFTPFGILFFYWMGSGLETHLGRATFSRLLIFLALAIPAVAAVWWMLLGVESSTFLNGQSLFFSGLLVAFATLYPKTEAWGWIPFKWVAFACIFCGSLMLFASRSWISLSQLWGSCAVGFGYIRFALEQEYDDAQESPFARVSTWWKRRKFKVVQGGRAVSRGPSESMDEMDTLLDKIARSGIASLTSAEKTRLEKARQALLKKEGR